MHDRRGALFVAVQPARGGIDTVTLPFHGGKPHVLVRHAIDPSWNR